MKIQTIPALTARTQLGQIMEISNKKNMHFIIEKRSEPQVAIIPYFEYAKKFKIKNTKTKLKSGSKEAVLSLAGIIKDDTSIVNIDADKYIYTLP